MRQARVLRRTGTAHRTVSDLRPLAVYRPETAAAAVLVHQIDALLRARRV
jgi:hypothetical protein